MASRVIRDGASNTITIVPPDGQHSATMLIMHGLGDSADGFADVAEMFSSRMPYCKFILPTAPCQPVTLNGGMAMNSWYDIVGLDDRASETCDGLAESCATIRDVLKRENAAGIPYSRMVLAGFSQGGAMSLTVGMQLQQEEKLAGILVMSGYLPAAKNFHLTPGLEDTPILHCHGLSDPMVRYDWAEKTKAEITRQGASQYELKGYPGLTHSVSPEELNHALDFLTRVLPNDASFAIPAKDPADMSVKELKEAIRAAGLSAQAVGFCEKSEYVQLLSSHRNKSS
eukprot:CAMPEP_0185018640 /NCGR_PEP_ID=MMETSP1103-20130426/1297_1 /TAXON_ID=36769 /ORGANISM="Paraphysomonas bandaiensis, Strain Caron Lab Isolate" /LENGTH=284 /DNA_ID=CAMNT_0027548517 /DNA_START=126 /DNA_END=980 /DNA_ORIENTATION=+